MRQTVNVSLSGVAFSIETEGYSKLQSYLESIEDEYPNSVDAQELLSDIEARITELILNRQSSSLPVTIETVDSIITQMGFPEPDGQESKEQSKRVLQKESRREESIDDMSKTPYVGQQSIPRRLYRNPKGAMLAGVCSGLASYFNADPAILRLGFLFLPLLSIAMLFFRSGEVPLYFNMAAVLTYIALWVVTPKAKTPRQKLEMEGSQITKESLKAYIRDEMTEVEVNIDRITRSERSAKLFSSIVYVLGMIFKILLYIFGVLIIVGLFFAMIFSVLRAVHFVIYDYSNNFIGNSELNITAATLITLIPFVVMIIGVISRLFEVKIKKIVYGVLFAIWMSVLVYGTVVLFRSYVEDMRQDKLRIEERRMESQRIESQRHID